MKSPKEIGEILKEARQKKSLTKEKIYKATHIQGNIIEALEEGRADEILSRAYVLLFLKKYASFLDLDSNSLTRDYKASYTDEEKQILDLDTAKDQPTALNIVIEKWMTIWVFAGLALIFIFFTLFLGTKLKSFYSRRKVASIKAQETISASIFPIPSNKPIEVILQCSEDVWMKVTKDGSMIFQGTLQKNKEKSISSDNKIELWVGKAEVLNFTVNGKSLGKIGRGVIKNIQISKQGLKIGNDWLFKAKE